MNLIRLLFLNELEKYSNECNDVLLLRSRENTKKVWFWCAMTVFFGSLSVILRRCGAAGLGDANVCTYFAQLTFALQVWSLFIQFFYNWRGFRIHRLIMNR